MWLCLKQVHLGAELGSVWLSSGRSLVHIGSFVLFCSAREPCGSSVSTQLDGGTPCCTPPALPRLQVVAVGSDHGERARLAQWKHRWLLADSRGRRRRSALCLTHGSAILCLFACLHNRSDFCGQNRLVFVCFWRNIFGGQVQTTVVWAGAAAAVCQRSFLCRLFHSLFTQSLLLF